MSDFNDFRVVIPVRMNSKRLPGKPLLEMGGLPMIQHVYQRALESCASSVVIATASEEIREVAEGFGATVCLTSADHPSGTDRLAEVVVAMGYDDSDIVVNLQGDEPLMPPQLIQRVAEDLSIHDMVKLSTACEVITDPVDLLNPDVVKVVLNHRGFAIYFSRAPIPWNKALSSNEAKSVMQGQHYRHIGLYAYRAGFLSEYLAWAPSPLDQMESLEQLRVLWQGCRIHCIVQEGKSVASSVDGPEDLERVRALMGKSPST